MSNENQSIRVAFWHPNKNKEGVGIIFEYNPSNSRGWLTFIPEQNDENKKFNIDKKLVAKLGLVDLGEMLAVIKGRQEGLGTVNDKGQFGGLCHKFNDDDSTFIGLSRYQNKYSISISVKKGKNPPVRLSGLLTNGEIEILESFLTTSLGSMIASQSKRPEVQAAAE